ncbi:MAG: hypothetical protein QM727_04435 [Niabella sp.]
MEKKLNFTDYRVNPDGTKYYKTNLTLVVHKKFGKKRRVLDTHLYTSSDCTKGILPCVLIDSNKNLISIFTNSKELAPQYEMEGYVYSSNLSLKLFNKKVVFKGANAGWFSFFGGSNNGNPELWHFSAAGYYAVFSKQTAEGWKNYIIGNIDPNDVRNQYEEHDNVLYASSLKVDSMNLKKKKGFIM